MKRVLAGMVTFAMALACMAWSSPAAAADKKYALLMSHMTNAFTMEMAGAVQDKAKELKANLTVFEAGQDVAKQISQIE